MKVKVLVGAVGLVLALVAAVLVAPSFINWNEYKDEIAARVTEATGRKLVIGGDIRIAVLPAPALIAHDVSLANIDGASTPNMVRLKSLEVRIALGPLLGGNIQVDSISLVEPVIDLEVLADGRRNWVFARKAAQGGKAGAPAGAPAGGSAGGPGGEAPAAGVLPAVRLDNFVIKEGTLTYRDDAAGTVERVEHLNATIAAASLSGPFESTGTAVARGVPVRYEVSLGRIIQERTVPINLALGLTSGEAKLRLSGALVSLHDKPKFRGTVKGDGKALAGLIGRFLAGGSLPGFLAQPFAFEGALEASASAAELKDLKLRLGDTDSKGAVHAAWGGPTNVAATLAVNRIDLDRWLAMPAYVIKPGQGAPDKGAGGRSPEGKAAAVPGPGQAAPESASPSLTVPRDVTGSIKLSADSVTFRRGIIRDVQATADLANGEITVSQLSARLPGGTDAAVFGFVAFPKGEPRFDGETEITASDLRGIFRWLGVALPDLPSDRLRKMTLVSKFTATPKQVDVKDIDLRFDSSRVTGAVSVPLRSPLSFGADVTLDRLNLDAYLPKPGGRADKPPAAATGGAKKAAAAKPAAEPEAPGILAAMHALTTFSANLRARVRTLVYRRAAIKDAFFDGTLYQNALTVHRLSVARMAGASVQLSGKVEGIGGLPKLKGVGFEISAKDVSRLVAFAGGDASAVPENLGPVSLKGRAEGALLTPSIELALKAAGAVVRVSGSATLLPVVGPSFDGRLQIKHGDVARLLRTAGLNYRPAGRLGGLDIAAAVKGNASSLSLDGIKGQVGPVAVTGKVAVDVKGPRPKITAALETGEIITDLFLPAKRTSWWERQPGNGAARLVPARWRRPGDRSILVEAAVKSGGIDERWSTEPIDLSVLGAFDAALDLKSSAIAYDTYRVENAALQATVTDGVFKARQFSGILFGGALKGTAALAGGTPPRMNVTLDLRDADIARAVGGAASGKMTLKANLAAAGASVADIVQVLGGTGSIAVKGLKVRKGGKRTALAGVLGLVSGLNRIGGTLVGKKAGKGLADVTGSFRIEQGVARSDDLRLVSAIGRGQAAGTVDLPRWRIDMTGEIMLLDNVWSQIIARASKKNREVKPIPFQVKGRLDAPNVKLETGGLPGGLRVPGVEKLIKKAPPAVGGLLQRLVPGLGGQPQAASPPPGATPLPPPPGAAALPPPPSQPGATPPPPPPQPAQPKRKLRPEDILKGLFGGK